MKIISLTDKGKVRKENQDNYWCALLDVEGVETGILCICDGMGGLSNGQLASKIVTEAIRDYLVSSDDFSGLREVITKANTTVHDLGKSNKQIMGTTCTVVLCQSGTYKIYHVGDSRCYKVDSKGVVTQITEDHSALRKFNITKENNPELYKKYKNKLTRCIGVKPEVVLDYFEGTYFSGDVFLVCSDGLWHNIDFESLQKGNFEDLRSSVDACIGLGETDNITVEILKV